MLTGVLAGLAAGAFWGLVFVVPRLLNGFSPVDIAAGRYVAWGLLSALLVFGTPRERRWPTWPQLGAAFTMSVLGATGYYLLVVLAVRDAGTALPSLIVGTIPIWLMLLGKPGHLRWATLLPGLALTAAGLSLMFAAEQSSDVATDMVSNAAAHPHIWRGIALAVVSMVSWTVFALYNAAWLRRHPEVTGTVWSNWLGLVTGASAVAMWMVAGSEAKSLLAQNQTALAALVFVATGVGSAWLGSILWNVASRRLSTSLCGQLIVSETLFALFYSFVWDGAWPSPLQWAACVLFTLGIIASIRAHR
ncbi:transporter [Rhodoferax koreense]|uniref:Transporter n=1 Tax=Rhodoferax koreensis TaxID=1842727 RepID=A0A1P8JVY1_9BURK|nr:DMT family transporter [Rhodoferax koreense]APW37907.1 transporter [Rhodoferax koreense]